MTDYRAPKSLDVRALAQALAERLDAVAPSSVTVEFSDMTIGVIGEAEGSTGQGVWEFDDATARDDKRIDALREFCWQVVSGIQDGIVRDQRRTWPQVESASNGPLALPKVVVTGEAVHVGFVVNEGDPRSVLDLPPIPFSEFGLTLRS